MSPSKAKTGSAARLFVEAQSELLPECILGSTLQVYLILVSIGQLTCTDAGEADRCVTTNSGVEEEPENARQYPRGTWTSGEAMRSRLQGRITRLATSVHT